MFGDVAWWRCSCWRLAVGLFARSRRAADQNQNDSNRASPSSSAIRPTKAGRDRERAQRCRPRRRSLRSIGFEIVEGADLSQHGFPAQLSRIPRQGRSRRARGDRVRVFLRLRRCSSRARISCVSVDARLDRESDIPLQRLRLSDLMRSLADSAGARQGFCHRRRAAAAVQLPRAAAVRAGLPRWRRRRAC